MGSSGVATLKNGRTSVHDDQRSGRPSIVTAETVEKIEKALHDVRRLTVDELSAMFPQISRCLLQETITETLGYRKLLQVTTKMDLENIAGTSIRYLGFPQKIFAYRHSM